MNSTHSHLALANTTGLDPIFSLSPLYYQEGEHSNAQGRTLFATIIMVPLLTIVIVGVIMTQLWSPPQSKNIPKGPWGFPIIGLFPFLTRYPELTLDQWARKYGVLYSIRLGNQLFIIISDPRIAKDLLVKRGAVCSDRKQMFIKSQTLFAGRGITASTYGDRWRKHRRIATTWLSSNAVNGYTNVLDFEAADMIKALFDDCSDGEAHVNPQAYAGRCSLNNMLAITFGFRTDSIHHPMVKQSLEFSREFMNLTGPVSNLVDFIPVLRKLPTSIRTRGRHLHQSLVATYGGLVKNVEDRIRRGVPVNDCLAKTLAEVRKKEELDDKDMAILASAFMIGGVETTASIMQWFSALIPAYPEIQKKAQAELDRVVGRTRLPDVEDEANLPYCRAIIKEVARCHNPFWLGTPHYTSEGFQYEHHFIPKGTVLLLNTWTMHHDPKRYPDPMKFNPERYLNDHFLSSTSARLSDPYMRDHWMFGAGRRICAGMLVAEREIWLTISRMLWAFEMIEIPDKPIDLAEYDGESGRSPVPFQIRLKPRFKGVEEVLDRHRNGISCHTHRAEDFDGL